MILQCLVENLRRFLWRGITESVITQHYDCMKGWFIVTSVSLFNPLCAQCRSPMGEMSQDEFEALILWDGSVGKCFYCEPLGAQAKPEIFWNWLREDVFVIDGQKFFVTHDGQNLEAFGQSHAHERAPVRGLSSVTYLNRKSKEFPVLESLTDYVDCPECKGQSWVDSDEWTHGCGTCNAFGGIPILARWVRFLLGMEKVNA